MVTEQIRLHLVGTVLLIAFSHFEYLLYVLPVDVAMVETGFNEFIPGCSLSLVTELCMFSLSLSLLLDTTECNSPHSI